MNDRAANGEPSTTVTDAHCDVRREVGLNGPGRGGFQNTALVFNPIAERTVPYSSAGAGRRC